MAATEGVSPSSEGTCILRPSHSKNDQILDVKENVKTGNLQSSLKNDSETSNILVSGENSCIQPSQHLSRARKRKRRNSMSDNPSTGPVSQRNVKRRKGSGHHKRNASSSRIILPTNFLHGGNITDPLNLHSMMDENVNRALNAVTPSSSPLPPRNSVIDYVTPADSTDPLGLNNFVEPSPTSKIIKVKNKKTKRKKNQMSRSQDRHSAKEMTPNSDLPIESQSDLSPKQTGKADTITSRKNSRSKRAKQSPPIQLAIPQSTTQIHIRDPIVSPAIPQDTRRTKSHVNARHRRRKHGGKQSTNDAGIQTDSAEIIDEKLRCGSEKIWHGSHFSPVKRRRTHSENLCSNSWPDEGGSSTFFSSFFCDSTEQAGRLETEKDLPHLLVKPIGSCIKQEDCSQSPAQSYMNSEKMSPRKSAVTDVKQETCSEINSGKQGTAIPQESLKSGNASLSRSGTNKMKSKRPYNARFQYGNYNKYYGYRNEEKFKDVRMECLKKEWFKDKDILDIGCNAGHLTLLIARDYQPRKIVGIDIDDGLIHIARNNIRHYASNSKSGKSGSKFPASMAITMGPLATPPVETGKDDTTAAFPNNVNFFQGNYVPKKDEILRFQEPEYDVILCMSVSKWVHLNWGDEGLMRLFRRAFKQLRAGGMFILEPQPWATYASKKKMCEQLNENYQTLQIRPDSFPTILTKEIGFAKVEHVKTVEKNSTKGFKRPIQAYYKPE